MRALLAISLLLSLAAPAAEPQWAGTYTGDWNSSILNVKGSFRLTLAPEPGGKLRAEVMFTMGDRKVETTMKSLRLEGNTIECSYEFDLVDNRLMSTIHGELAGGRLEGKYETKTVPDGTPFDEGAWKAASKSQ